MMAAFGTPAVYLHNPVNGLIFFGLTAAFSAVTMATNDLIIEPKLPAIITGMVAGTVGTYKLIWENNGNLGKIFQSAAEHTVQFAQNVANHTPELLAKFTI